MLMPPLSATAIGLTVGLIAGVLRRRPTASLLWGVGGAWIAFVLGAFVGGVFDVIARSGGGVALAGHIAAIAGALVAGARHRPTEAPSAVEDVVG